MKKIIFTIFTLIICGGLFYYIYPKADEYSDFLAEKIINKPKVTIPIAGKYAKNDNYGFVQLTDNFTPYAYQDLLNIIYTIINNRWTSFSFYCPVEYEDCIDDANHLLNDQNILTYINDFIHPYNNFISVRSLISPSGMVTIKPSYLYTEEQIEQIEKKLDEIVAEIINDNDDNRTRIRKMHDYIINNTRYDIVRTNTGQSQYQSHNAYGLFLENYAICNGYTDAMAIYLSRLNINNYKISTLAEMINDSDYGHVWNALFLDGEWLHLDLTWDDPVSDDGKDYLFYKYFLINNEKLAKADNGVVVIQEHNYDPIVYLEYNPLA